MLTIDVGKLLTTPSRLLKLVMPLTTVDANSDRKDVAPLALLVHPQQPLSYLERLVQAELPTITNDKGENRIPGVSFRAMESEKDEIKPKKKTESKSESQTDRETLGEGVQSYSGSGREGTGDDTGEFVRWSASTEIGDFIRDAARAKEFEVEIEGNSDVIKIAVPSFNDRTFYLRQRLRRTSRTISDMTVVKKECDQAAHRGAQRIAIGGCGVLLGYWYLVYRLTFETDLGWDTMEPVTYLVGLSTLIGGYMWFLWHNREVSYRQAMNITVSKRQTKMYELKGFDLHKWETLIEEANAIRKEIKAVASEYDVEWDEQKDSIDKEVSNAMRKERKNNGNSKKSKKGDDDDDDDD
jgi:calcium uniporter protein, mitochondrial